MFSYYGSKRSVVQYYPGPRYRRIIEPFCGAAAYSCRYPDNEVWLYDVDSKIIAVWQWLIGASERDIMSLPLLKPGERIPDSLSDPERWFLGYMISAAPAQPKLTATIKTNWTPARRQIVVNLVGRIKHWNAGEGDFRQASTLRGTWFVDPPYQTAGKYYANRLDVMDYQRLAHYCQHVWKGQVIVCENLGADWLPFKPFLPLKGQSNTHQIEAICEYTNV